jgi:hypothetical protein
MALTIEGGDLTLANITGNGGNISASGTITGANIYGANLSLSGNIVSANVTGNISAGNISLTGNIFTYGANVYGVNGLKMEGGDLTISSITGTGGNISISGNITAANLSNLPSIAKSGYNVQYPTVTLGTIIASIDGSGNPTIRGALGTVNGSYSGENFFWDGSAMRSGQIGSNASSFSGAFGGGIGVTFANAGETVTITLNDDTNGHLYEVFWAAGSTGPATGYGFIQI